MQGVTSIAAINEERRATAGRFASASGLSPKRVKRHDTKSASGARYHVGPPYERDISTREKIIGRPTKCSGVRMDGVT